ncbi:HPr family phosphocarrier protein, partial [Sinomonas humi]
AAIFAEAAAETGIEVTIAKEGDPEDEALDASSILSLMSLGAEHGQKVTLRATGPNADQALDHLVTILETDHDAQ